MLLVVALAVLQGLTEFLPVSSSGHLRLLSELWGVEDPQTLLDIMLHVGTLVAVVVVYRTLFAKMTGATLRVVAKPKRWAEEPYARLVALAIVGTVPTGAIAILLGDTMESAAASIAFVGGALVVNGVVLLVLGWLSKRRGAQEGRPIEALRLTDALVIGTAQGFGIIRGISRSGSTITAGMAVGLNQDAAAAFSFVLSVPAILGAMVMKFDAEAMAAGQLAPTLVGMLVAALVGTLALILLLKLLGKGKLHHFAWYCFALGAAAIYLGLSA